jgi:hypothetical protein
MSRSALAQAVEANLTAFHVALSEWPEMSLHRGGDRIWTVSQRRFSLCNVLLEAHLDPTDVDAQITRALAPYVALNVNVMALDLASLAPAPALLPGFVTREVADPATLDLWRLAVDRRFGWPRYGAEDLTDNLEYFFRPGIDRPFVAYVGALGEEPVASSLVFFGAGVAGI